MKKVAVIILVYNGQEYIPECLDSVLETDYQGGSLEVVAVDNASTDDSVELLKKYGDRITLIENKKNIGFGAGNNAGVQYAMERGFDYVVLLNQDTVVEANWLSELVKTAEQNDKIGAVQARLMRYKQKDIVNAAGCCIHYLGFGFAKGEGIEWKRLPPITCNLSPTTYHLQPITYASGAAVLYKASILREIGLFDPDFFMYHDDLELGWRMRLGGYDLVLAEDAIVYHKHEFSRSIKKFYWMERNRFICLLTNYKWRTFVLILPALLLMELGLFFMSLFSGWWKEKLRVYAYFLRLSSWRKIFGRRKMVQAKRRIGDKEVIKYFAGKIEFQEMMNPLLRYVVNPVFDLYWRVVRRVVVW